jgi:hypothetical protein
MDTNYPKGTKLHAVDETVIVVAGPFEDPDAGGGAYYQVYNEKGDPDNWFDLSVRSIARWYVRLA